MSWTDWQDGAVPEPPAPTRWQSPDAAKGAQRAVAYRERFERMASSGVDVHGEATFCAALLHDGDRVLDAGCGTGRVAARLAELGWECVGVDADPDMLANATHPGVHWAHVDLSDRAALSRAIGGPVDLVVAAGNVIPLLAPGTEQAVLANLAHALMTGGYLVTGFGLNAEHLPLAEAPFGLAEYDRWCRRARLRLVDRFADWQRAPYAGDGYAVSVHRRIG